MTNNVLTIVFYITVTYFILMGIAWLYNFILIIHQNKQKAFSPKFYIKELPFLLNRTAMYRIKTAGIFLGIILLTTIIAFTFLSNLTPFGVTLQYAMEQNTKNISELGPKDRIKAELKNGQKVFKQSGELVYFTTEMPFAFETATIRIFYKNDSPEQTLSIGYQDQEEWHYSYKPTDVPYLNSLTWTRNGYDPVLYQRNQKYISVNAFLENPPIDGIIGIYDYVSSLGSVSHTNLPSYEPRRDETTINTHLRGKHILYAYLDNEPFNMTITKQDLNWYDGLDNLTIKIYKDDEQVHEVTADDDGVEDTSRKIMPPQEINIKNPGKEVPESGVYKIVIDANGDTIIKQIKTNLHKLVFSNSIFPIKNSNVYPGIVASTSATKVYTNALSLSAITYHDQGKQNILVGNEVLGVNNLHIPSYLIPKDQIAEVTIPQNDVVLNGFLGYFAFDKDQFFLPTKYHILPITKPEDVELVDYILTDYLPSRKEGEWQVNEQTFDLRSAYIKDGKLSWIIKAPKLKERKGEIIIKDIQITFHKKGWL